MMLSQPRPPDPSYAHVLVVLSMVLGLSVTQLLKGAAQLYRSRPKVRSYWLYWAWTGLEMIFILLLWWTYWNYRSISDWDFVRFVLYLSPAVTFFIPDRDYVPQSIRKPASTCLSFTTGTEPDSSGRSRSISHSPD